MRKGKERKHSKRSVRRTTGREKRYERRRKNKCKFKKRKEAKGRGKAWRQVRANTCL